MLRTHLFEPVAVFVRDPAADFLTFLVYEVAEGGRITYRESVHRDDKELSARKTEIIVFFIVKDSIDVLVSVAVCGQFTIAVKRGTRLRELMYEIRAVLVVLVGPFL